jgi:GNAT superfamily N-acetyltransferase
VIDVPPERGADAAPAVGPARSTTRLRRRGSLRPSTRTRSARDIPTEHSIDDVRWEDWLEGAWKLPDLDRDASLVALVDGEPAALTHVLVDADSGRALSSLTGTARRFRGRGLAHLVKHHALVLAGAKGVSLAATSNHDANRAMLAVNERLGYRPLATKATYTRRSR